MNSAAARTTLCGRTRCLTHCLVPYTARLRISDINSQRKQCGDGLVFMEFTGLAMSPTTRSSQPDRTVKRPCEDWVTAASTVAVLCGNGAGVFRRIYLLQCSIRHVVLFAVAGTPRAGNQGAAPLPMASSDSLAELCFLFPQLHAPQPKRSWFQGEECYHQETQQ